MMGGCGSDGIGGSGGGRQNEALEVVLKEKDKAKGISNEVAERVPERIAIGDVAERV